MEYNKILKNIKKDFTGMKKIRVAIMGDIATQFFIKLLKGLGYEKKIDFEIYESYYDSVRNEIMNKESEFYKFTPDYTFVILSTEKIIDEFYNENNSEKNKFADKKYNEIKEYIDTIEKNINTNIIMLNFAERNDMIYGNYALKLKESFLYNIKELNRKIVEYAIDKKWINFIDVNLLIMKYGIEKVYDKRMYALGKILYTMEFHLEIVKNFTEIVDSYLGRIKKCVILDLDNTLWGGIIGEDGIEKIEIGEIGTGKIYTEFQKYIRQLKERGIILAVCSKNDEHMAKEVFIKHPDMILKLSDISIFIANWESKAENIRKIKEKLNIGYDSMIFIDDSKFEREIVKEMHPEVEVPEMPEDNANWLEFLKEKNYFETISISEEDRIRAESYIKETEREEHKQNFKTEEEFLESLEMKIEWGVADKFTEPRIFQLIQRSNQFNVRGIKYSEAEFKDIICNKKNHIFYFKLKDKFGNYGLISAIILKEMNQKEIYIDTLVMSCRVLKRGVENFIFNKIVEFGFEKSKQRVVGEYLKTDKNSMVEGLYEKYGFHTKNRKIWEVDINSYKMQKIFIKKEEFINNG